MTWPNALRSGLPTAEERRCLYRLWIRHRRQPLRALVLPAAWRRRTRLAFWWTLLRYGLEEPGCFLAGILALPGWLVLWLYRMLHAA